MKLSDVLTALSVSIAAIVIWHAIAPAWLCWLSLWQVIGAAVCFLFTAHLAGNADAHEKLQDARKREAGR